MRSVSPGCFETTGVDEPMARHVGPESEALGACILLYGSRDCTRVVGVAEPTATTGFRDGRSMDFHVPQHGDSPYRAIHVPESGVTA